MFLSNYNNKTYLIEDERYWRLDEVTGIMDPGYPKEMSMWRQVPYPVDAAVIWKGGKSHYYEGGNITALTNFVLLGLVIASTFAEPKFGFNSLTKCYWFMLSGNS